MVLSFHQETTYMRVFWLLQFEDLKWTHVDLSQTSVVRLFLQMLETHLLE